MKPIARMLVAVTALLAVFLSAGPAPALAIDLDTARAQGLVGERYDGYVAAVGQQPPEVAELVKQVNAGRFDSYKEIAVRNGTTVQAVAAISAQKLINRLPPGTWVMTPKGGWKRK